MGKDLSGSPKYHQLEKKKGHWSRILGTTFCCLIFYLIGAWQNNPAVVHIDSKSVSVSGCETLDFAAHHSSAATKDVSKEVEAIEPCDMSYSEYTPCQDLQLSLRFPRERLIYRERHCPAVKEKVQCLIPAPPGYKNPFPWPKSRDFAWYANVPHKELTVEKAIQNWIQYEGKKFYFPGGGTMFPRGADAYIDDINALIPLTDGSIRTALDTGCGVASWGAYLLKRNILTMSFAPRDTHEGQVQFALERGVPAMIGIMASQRLSYPARSFDMAHCSRCLIPWSSYDGLYLIEIDRVLRPGGYWILSGPPVNWKLHWKSWQRTQEDLKQEMNSIEATAKKLCWKKIAEKGNLAIWQKPFNQMDCLKSKQATQKPQLCDGASNPDSAWYIEMQSCISLLPETSEGDLEKWPARLTAIPPRISSGSVPGITGESFDEDTKLWATRVGHYKNAVVPLLSKGRYRNIMDMNAGLGGFAAALTNDKVWVMNVVPSSSEKSTLGVIYERGLIGTYHDWCEAFSTYPRTYDLLHANSIFTTYKDKCSIREILLEMDRILRPEGAVMIRDDVDVLNEVRNVIKGMRWQSKLSDHENGPFNKQKILVAVKSYWTGNTTTSS